MKRYRCSICYGHYVTEDGRCPWCYLARGDLKNFSYHLRKIAAAGMLEVSDVDHINRLIAEYIATHWSEKENPRHGVMEAVCQLSIAA